MDYVKHWDDVYSSKPLDQISWAQKVPEISLRLIKSVARKPEQPILDVGSGASSLIPYLLKEGFQKITVVDISNVALEKARDLLGEESSAKITWKTQDVRDLQLPEKVFVWHDRAVLHFLSDPEDQKKYVAALSKTLLPGGYFVVGTFAKGGMTECSGLKIVQYDAKDMSKLLGPDFQLLHEETGTHITPADKKQPFWFGVYCFHCNKK